MNENELRKKYVATLAAYVGKAAKGSANHKKIIDTYNSVLPHPRGYKMTYEANWCAATVCATAIMCDMLSIFAFECSCTLQIQQWKSKGRWVENDAYVPKTGDLIYYDWSDDGKGDDTSDPDHVGVVESVSGNVITVIEGNKGNNVGRRNVSVNGRYIRGFATPDYASMATKPKPAEVTAINMPTLKLGDEGHTVRTAQRILKGAGYHGNNGKELVINKKFGADTERAVKKYQEVNGLTITGKIDGATWKMMLLGTK